MARLGGRGNTAVYAAAPLGYWGPYGPYLPVQQGLIADPPSIAYGSIAIPLGGHLALSIKEKIWRGEFIAVFSLLHAEPDPIPRVGDPIKNQETIRKQKIDKNFTNWLYGYVIYTTVLLQVHPSKATALIKYTDAIHRAYRKHFA